MTLRIYEVKVLINEYRMASECQDGDYLQGIVKREDVVTGVMVMKMVSSR